MSGGRAVLPAVAALLMVALGGCGALGFGIGHGPLGPPADPGHLCVGSPATVDGTATLGHEALTSMDPVSIELLSASFSQPSSGLEFLEARVVRIRGRLLVGTRPGYPPELATGHDWGVAIGHDLVPLSVGPNTAWSLVVGVRIAPGATVGTATGLTLAYLADETLYRWQSSTSIEVRADQCP